MSLGLKPVRNIRTWSLVSRYQSSAITTCFDKLMDSRSVLRVVSLNRNYAATISFINVLEIYK